MIRVIAVDDEKTIRDGIGRFVRETEGFELLATCADGGEAYDKILAKHPDLVICDIIMPVFDGIELIRKCREAEVESEFVLLSGYSEFEYARAAIRYGVLDYINKPVNPDALRNLLDNVRRVVEKKTLLKKQLQSSVFEKVIENGSSEMGRAGTALISELHSYRVLVINGTGDEVGETAQRLTADTVAFCEQMMKKAAHEEYIAYSRKNLAVLVLTGMDVLEHCVENICDKILSNALGRGYPAYIGIGDTAREMEEIPLSYRMARAAMYEGQCQRSRVCYFERLPYSYVSPAKTYSLDISDVIHAIHLGDLELARSEAERLTAYYRKTAPPYVVYSFILKCMQEVLEYVGESVVSEQLCNTPPTPADLSTARDLDTLLDRFHKIIHQLFGQIKKEEKISRIGGTMDEVLGYIRLHYMEDISVEKVCNVFYFNPSYFSALFKSKMDCNFNDYVTQLRIKKAKELLQSGRYRINEVAVMVGYHSPRYFSKVFKSRTGELPQEYKGHFL